MSDDAHAAVYSFVERAFIRLQAGDMLSQCMAEGSVTALQTLVEGLVLAGPNGLDALREVYAEVAARKKQLQDDGHAVITKFVDDLKSHGVVLPGQVSTSSVSGLTPTVFLSILHEQGISQEGDRLACLQHLQESLGLLDTIAKHKSLLEEIEVYLEDWMWGLMYQTTVQTSGLDWKH